MKKSLLLLFILIVRLQVCIGQPNGGFENWTPLFYFENPDDWQTLNFLALASPPNPLSAFKATGIDKHSGNYALKLVSVYLNNNPFPGQVEDTTGGVFTGVINHAPFTYRFGFPYTSRPASLEFWAKYLPVGADTGGSAAYLTRFNGVFPDTIAVGIMSINYTPNYTHFTCNLTYRSDDLPDTAVIGFSASKPESGIARQNSTLYVDDVAFTGWVGIDEHASTNGKVKAFPNPAKENITILCEHESADHIRIMNSVGKLTDTYKFDNTCLNVNTSNYAEGNYFYEILDKQNKILVSGKFCVKK